MAVDLDLACWGPKWRHRAAIRSGLSRLVVGTPVMVLRDRIGGFANALHAGDQRVLDEAGLKAERRVDLVVEHGLHAIHVDLVAIDHDRAERSGESRAACVGAAGGIGQEVICGSVICALRASFA